MQADRATQGLVQASMDKQEQAEASRCRVGGDRCKVYIYKIFLGYIYYILVYIGNDIQFKE
jgi:hypothetical protein